MQIQEIFEKYKNQLLSALIILVACFIALKIFNKQLQAIQVLKEKKQVEVNKKAIFENISTNQEKLKIYKDYINRKDIANEINVISDLARASSVEIISIKPSEGEKGKFYTRYVFRARLSAENYHQLGDFVARLENHPDVFSVDSLAINVNSRLGPQEKEILDADLQVSTIISENGELPNK